MPSNCCGICMYGKNENKYPDKTQNECMLDGYQAHLLNYCCSRFKRDFQKQIVVKSIHDVKR